MPKTIYDHSDNDIKFKLNDYQTMDSDGRIHATLPVSDHMHVDLDDGSMHVYLSYEDEKRTPPPEYSSQLPDDQPLYFEEDGHIGWPEAAAAAVMVVVIIICFLLVFLFL